MSSDHVNGQATASDQFLKTTRKLVEKSIEQESVPEDREAFFEALFLLQSGDVSAAIEDFRAAARTCSAPFDALSSVALAECQRIRGREAAAIKEWKEIGSNEDAPHAARYVSWLSLAALAEKRDDKPLLNKADAALEEFPDH